MLPFLHTTLKQKWGGGAFSNVPTACAYAPSLCSLAFSICPSSTIIATATTFLNSGIFAERVVWKISSAYRICHRPQIRSSCTIRST